MPCRVATQSQTQLPIDEQNNSEIELSDLFTLREISFPNCFAHRFAFGLVVVFSLYFPPPPSPSGGGGVKGQRGFQKDPEGVCWRSVFLEAWGTKAKNHHFLKFVWFLCPGTPCLQKSTWPKNHFGIPLMVGAPIWPQFLILFLTPPPPPPPPRRPNPPTPGEGEGGGVWG
jgi:hypothetical protein